MIEYQEVDREMAVRDVTQVILRPLAAMSVPDRESAYELARFHKITAEDLLDLAMKRARSA
jgi:hypothetical protein